jgi:predicted metalloprotease with PDZ domain
VTLSPARVLTSCAALCALLVLLPLSSSASAPEQETNAPEAPLIYRLSIPALASHRLHLQITEEMPSAGMVEFAIPAWSPGYYQILHYEADIENVRAKDDAGHALTVTHSSPRVWAVETAGLVPPPTRILVDYDVNAHDSGLGFFGASLDGTLQRGYINGASTFLYEVGKTRRPVRLETALPTGWKLATPLTPTDMPAPPGGPASAAATASTHSFEAESYDALIDCPLQFGQFTSTEFASDGATFQCVCVGSSDWDKARIGAILGKIVHAAIQIFGKPAFQRYVFFYHIGGSGFEGGLEHRNSTVIHLGTALKDGKAEEFQTVTAHEFFHAWNVKRLRPAGLGPFDYTQPVRTASLWWAEGVTDYYADVVLYRAGLRDRTWLLNDLADRMAELDSNPARLRVTLEEASRKAWEGESEGFDGLSYYLKGSLVGFYFDLRLRDLTGGKRSLDDVMRLLDTDYGSKNRGYPEDALLTALEAVAQTDLHAAYADLLRSEKEIDWNPALARTGIALQREAVSYLGVQLHSANANANDGLIIDSIETGSAAARCRIQAGDTVLALNGEPVTVNSLKDQLARLAPGSALTLTVLRGGERVTLHGDSGVRYIHYQLTPAPPNGPAPASAGLFLPTPARSEGIPAH